MMDLLFIGLSIALFAVSFALLEGFERLR